MAGRIFNDSEAAVFLTDEIKLPVKVSTLRAKRRDGGGPVYGVVLSRIEYREEDLVDWAEGLRSKRFSNTAQAASGKAVTA